MKIDLEANIPGCPNFKWKEALLCPQWGVHVIPTKVQYYNLIKMFKKLQLIRDYLGRPITVTSGLRPVVYNKLIGGARFSAHKLGLAVDFVVKGMKPDRVRREIKKLMNEYQFRIEDLRGSSWIHIDDRWVFEGRNYFKP